ncbi:succinyldiaminopimelate desuccinylase [Variovorax beijingensis]|uniref:Succinyl-diaminopimelate desuccinylase n=2 Tax=Variovorax TaxID=34072 RepID=A0AAE3Y4J2_VARPD|nr:MULTISPECIES: succinyl-diaminopimelate desuccinylase [Variovorax]MBD9665212.1 succinyl-diaminopimelate desuccinylase [Variovorax sp. VRV01]MDP9967112.1 succinyl-diaminopimelate desuccinylase [Variovorax paradoxus]MDR6429479.1 succinyl-diaminopimelate desuccinylase [Variovorax paradoxus]TWD76824.1 succinyldiaminopimelate desuccinylase [Variovorax beijingensis]
MSRTLQLAEQLISRPSVTPDDAGCQQILGERLARLGFTLETIESGPPDFRVTNLWAVRRPAGSAPTKTLVFAGHTDVVPTGPVEQWTSHPFTPTHRGGKLYGRGACDMKTSVAAFVVSIEEFLAATPDPRLTLALLLTSDEEGPGVDGTVVVCNALAARGETIDYCIVGEPTAVERCGDMIKNGRRGTMSGKLTVHGVQGHIAYPHLAKNPVHAVAPALAELVAINAASGWDAGNAYFQPTSWQISNFHAGTGASNVIPGSAVIDFNFRFSTESTPESLQKRVHAVLDAHGVDCTLAWTIGGLPFLTTPGELVRAVQAAIADETGIATELSTSGGTSDARFIAKICKQVVELGPVNASIHKIDEHIDVAEIETLKNIYKRTLERLEASLAR